MLHALLALLATAAPVSAQPAARDQSGVPREWVIHDVVPPKQLRPGEETQIGRVLTIGDVFDRDRVGVSLTGISEAAGSGSLEVGLAISYGMNRPVHVFTQNALGRIYLQYYRTYLKTPSSVQVVVADSAQSWRHAGFDLFTHRPLGNLAPFELIAAYRARDLNGDGWEDVFYQRVPLGTGRPAHGALDGRTLGLLWERHESFIWGFTIPPKYTEPEGPPDVNGDGIPDFISSWPTQNAATGAWEHDVRALSGVDGTVLWQHRGPEFVYATIGADVTGDGVGDVALVHGDLFEVLDGASGTQLWQQDEQPLLAHVPPGHSFLGVDHPILIQRRSSGPGYDMCGVMITASATTYEKTRQIVHFDAQTGALLDVVPHPPDLQPWYGDPVVPQNGPAGQYMFEVGDMDGDGLDEGAWQVPAADFEVPGVVGTPMHIAILGLRTLWVPEQVQAGERVTARVAIPAAPGHEVYLVLSREFRPEGGWLADHWDTNLGPGTLLDLTSGRRPFTTTLDADGRGRLDFTVPGHPLLPGETIYARAIVLEPGTTDQVKTISTVVVIEILP